MAVFLEVARTGLAALLLHPTRSLVTVACLVAVLLPYLVCLGLSQGVQEQAALSLRVGADLYVTGRQFGRPAPVPLSAVEAIAKLSGVKRVVPRIVGGIVLGKEEEPAVVVGMPSDYFPVEPTCVRGRPPVDGRVNELVIGTELARRLRLEVGALVPPFYHSTEGERISRVVGVFTPEAGLWQANLILTTFQTAAHLFDQQETATDLLVWCRPGYEQQVASAVLALSPHGGSRRLRLAVTAREDVAGLFRSGLMHREGIVSLHYLLAFAVGILAVLVTSGFGLAERRREIGILKATGWQTDQVLLRGTVESFLLALAGASLAVVLAYVWLKGLNGVGIAGIFLTGVGTWPGFPVPFRLTPIPVLIAFLLGLVVVMTGTLYSTWRAAIAAPVEAMR